MWKIEPETKLDFDDVLIKPKSSDLRSRADVELLQTFRFKHSNREWTGVPLMVSNMDTTGTIEMCRSLAPYKILTCLHKHYQPSDIPPDLDKDYFAISTGTSDRDKEKLREMMEQVDPHFIVIDVANGYTRSFLEYCRMIRDTYPQVTIIAGNVATPDFVELLLDEGRVDVVKCGIGSGSVCTTRIKTGIGVPQLSVALECGEAAENNAGHVVSDGGCRTPGDIVKALAAGSQFVMLGGMMAGHEQSGGEVVIENGEKYRLFYGMASKHAQEKHNGGLAEYRSSEGKLRKILDRGNVENTVKDILGGIRSACTYVGAGKVENLYENTTFIKVNNQINDVFDKPTYQLGS